MVFLEIISYFVQRFRNYDSLSCFEIFPDFLEKEEEHSNYENIEDFRKVHWYNYSETAKVSKCHGNFAHCFHFVQVFEEGLYAVILPHTREGMTD